MGLFKQMCLVAPDRWVGSLALGLRRYLSQTRVLCVGDETANQVSKDLGIVSVSTNALTEGLRGSDLVLLGRRCTGLDVSLSAVLSSVDMNTTVVGCGHSLIEVSGIIGELNRDDVHYISVDIRGLLDPNADLSFATMSDIKDQLVTLTPSTIDALDAFSSLQECFQSMGARVIALSPRIHDRQLAELVHLPKVVLMPLVHHLVESLAGRTYSLSPESVRLLRVFSELTSLEAADWAKELQHNKHYLLSALDGYQKHMTSLREALAADRTQDRVSLLMQQVVELTAAPEPVSPSAEVHPQLMIESTPEGLKQMVDSLLTAVNQIEAGSTDEAARPGIQAVHKLIDQTHLVLDSLYKTNLLTNATSLVKQAESAPAEAAFGSDTREVVADFIEPAASTVEAKDDPYPLVTLSSPSPSWSEPVAPPIETKHDPVTMDSPKTFTQEDFGVQPTTAGRQDGISGAEPTLDFPQISEWERKLRAKPLETPQNEVKSEPHPDWSEADLAVPEMSVHTQYTNWDLKIQFRPELRVMDRLSHVLAGARISIRDVAKTETHDGRTVLCIALSNPNQRAQARQLLRQAGIPSE